MDITERYTTRMGRQYMIRLTYNERIKDTDKGTAFIRNIEVLDADTKEPVHGPRVRVQVLHLRSFPELRRLRGHQLHGCP